MASQVTFRVVRVPGDGDCGYAVIGVPREDAANALLDHLDDEIRAMIGMEIRSMLMDEDALPRSVRDLHIDLLLKERVEAQLELDAAEWKRGSNAHREVPLIEIHHQVVQLEEPVCERFVDSQRREGRLLADGCT